MSSIFQKWTAYLLKPVDGASVAAFRILFGVLLFWEVLRYFSHGWIESYYITPTFHFTYPFLDFVEPWPGNGMYLHFVVMGVLALMIALGLFYRLASLLFGLAFTYVFLLDKTYYLNHFYLIVLFSFLLWLIPAHRVASLDRWLFFRAQKPLVPRWSVFVLRAQVFIVYFYGGLAKLNADWLQGEPMRMWLAERTDFPVIGGAFTTEWAVLFFTYGGLLFDLGIGFLLVWRRTRRLAFVLAAVFHLLNARLFQIGIFPFLMLGATLIFAEPDWPRRARQVAGRLFAGHTWSVRPQPANAKGGVTAQATLAKVSKAPIRAYRLTWRTRLVGKCAPNLRKGEQLQGGFRTASIPTPDAGANDLLSPRPQVIGWPATAPGPRSSTAMLALIHVYLLSQLLIPLRHLLYPGDVSWTEEGHRFAWHMKLRDKQAMLRIYVTDPAAGQTWEVSPAVDLSRRQFDEMSTRPDMVLQYVHYLADRLSAGGRRRPIIQVDQQVSLNSRPYQPLIDPTVNLAEIPISLAAADWLLPLSIPLKVDEHATAR